MPSRLKVSQSSNEEAFHLLIKHFFYHYSLGSFTKEFSSCSLTDSFDLQPNSLGSFSKEFSSCSLTDSFDVDFSSFKSFFWESAKSLLISEVISSFRDVLSPSDTLFSILEDLADEGPVIRTSWLLGYIYSANTGEVMISLTISELSWRRIFLLWLLVVKFLVKSYWFVFSNWFLIIWRSKNLRTTVLYRSKRMSPLITVTYHIYTLLASFDHEQLSNFPQKFNHFLFFFDKTIWSSIYMDVSSNFKTRQFESSISRWPWSYHFIPAFFCFLPSRK